MSEFPLSKRLIDYTSSGVAADLDPIDDEMAIDLIAADDSLFNLKKKSFRTLAKNTLFSVPPYQRLYSWKKEQHEEFWLEFEDLLNAHLEEDRDTNVEDVFFGTMFLARDQEGNENIWEVIDGQQRLTSAFILLRCVLQRLENYGEDIIEHIELAEEKRKLRNIIYEETETGAQRNPSISLNKHDEEFFTRLMWDDSDCIKKFWEQDDMDGRKSEAYSLRKLANKLRISERTLVRAGIKEENQDDPFYREHRLVYESNERLLDAFDFYHTRLDNVLGKVESGLEAEGVDPDNASDEHKKRQIIALLNITNYLQRAFYLGRFEIMANQSDLRLKIFEILNSRGLSLTDTDQIRAAVINYSKSRRASEDLLEYWRQLEIQFNTDSSVIERFLKTYLATKIEGVNSINDADGYLLEAFSTRPDPDREPVKSYLADKENPGQEFKTISKFAEYYYQIAKTNELTDAAELHVIGEPEVVEEIYLCLRRLNSLARQWHPSALAAYSVACKEDGHGEDLLKLLQEIEIIALRRLLVGASPSDVEELHARGATEFWRWQNGDQEEENVTDTKSTEGEGESLNAFTSLQDWLITDFRRRVPTAFGKTFVQTLVQQESWSRDHMKGIWAKRAVEGLSSSGMVRQSYNPDKATLEHILPSTPIRSNADNPYKWLQTFFKIDDLDLCDPNHELSDEELDAYDTIQEEVIEYIRRLRDDEVDSDEDGEIERIEDLIEANHIEDIANTVLLGSRDNKSVKNSYFAKKFYFYHRSDSGFSDLNSNWYFTEDGPTTEDQWIATIEENIDRSNNSEENDSFPDLEDVFDDSTTDSLDGFWTYREQVRRRLYELPHILSTLEFDSLPGEIDRKISDLDHDVLRENQSSIIGEAQNRGVEVSEEEYRGIFGNQE